jgi:sulfite exporter TauE/SafE
MKETTPAALKATERTRVNRLRGLVMLIAGAAAIWKGWQIHRGQLAVIAYGLGALALALAAWHLTRRPPPPRV